MKSAAFVVAAVLIAAPAHAQLGGLINKAQKANDAKSKYDDLNMAGQEAYSLANFRGGARGRYLFAEAWIRNALDTHYVPVAFAYGQLAPSGFIGEMGRPRTFGVNAGVSF